MRQYLNDNWLFREDFSEEMTAEEWELLPHVEKVRLPHTVKETPLHYFDESIYQMVSGYQRKLFAPREWQGKIVLLTLEGAAHISEVFLNGEKVGEHRCGYTAFTVDLSERLQWGKDNFLTVKLDSRVSVNVPPFGYVIDYMTYGGIYRDVYLEVHEPVFAEDVFVYAEPSRNGGKMTVRVTMNRRADEDLVLRQSLRKKGEKEFAVLGEQSVLELQRQAQTLAGQGADRSQEDGRPVFQLEYTIEDCETWSLEQPALYELQTELIEGGDKLLPRHLECRTEVFGFRRAEFRADGFYLNGEKIKLRGLNRHQCYPYVGYAMPASVQKLDAEILKNELGLNAVRTSHYPQSHDFLDRCDELGLLVFTEMPGWQHIGDEAWKDQAVRNTEDMVRQYRNHPSIVLWGVRINESVDDDAFYIRTNEAAHRLDPYRATGGVRAHKKSSLLEDVYTYNDFVHEGDNKSCEKKAAVTSRRSKPYLISEYNGHMYPTKAFDSEDHRKEHAIRHANVLDAVAAEEDIAGCFGWCMFDYNTHQDFGSGDRVCYHGVMDMFRNPKQAAWVYSAQQEAEPVLELSSAMDIGEHPGGHAGAVWIYTNAEAVRMYKNDRLLREYHASDSPYAHLKHGPILADDFIGDAIEKGENFAPKQAAGIKEILNSVARFGLAHLPKKVYLTMAKMIVVYHMKPVDAVALYTKYVGDWGGKSTTYRLESLRGGEVVKTIVKEPVKELRLDVQVSHSTLTEEHTYDVAAVRIRVTDQNGNILPFYNEPVTLHADGDIALIGPDTISLSGGMGGTYVKSLGRAGSGTLHIHTLQAGDRECRFVVRCL